MPTPEVPLPIDLKNYSTRPHKPGRRLPKNYPPVYHPQAGSDAAGGSGKTPALDEKSRVAVMRWDLRSDIKKLSASDPQTPINALERPLNKPLPDPAVWSSNLVRAIFDALAGRRDLAALRRWIDPSLYRRLAARVQVLPPDARTEPVRVRLVRLCEIDSQHAESAVIIEDQGRVRATAIRLEAFRGRWRVTALEIG